MQRLMLVVVGARILVNEQDIVKLEISKSVLFTQAERLKYQDLKWSEVVLREFTAAITLPA